MYQSLPAAPLPPGAAAALEQATHLAVLAPSVHNTQPWLLELHDDRLVIRADRSRQLPALDPTGRELVQSVGAALFNARVGLAAAGWDADVDRCPDPADPDLLAVVRCASRAPDAALAALAPAVPRRRTNRRAFLPGEVPDGVLRGLAAGAAEEGAVLVPVLREAHRRLLGRLTQQAERLQAAEPGYRAELRRWTTRRPEDGDGVPAAAVPHVDGRQHDDLPLRDFDTGGRGGLPAETASGVNGTLVVLATWSDDPHAWLESGEAMQRVLLELTALGLAASPFTQLIEVPLTRTQLRSALAWDAHPQLILRIGHADPTPPTPRRRVSEVVVRP
jgi:nitroreductase